MTSRTEKISKALCWALRHNAVDHGMGMRPDGYVPLNSILAMDSIQHMGVQAPEILQVCRDSHHPQRGVRFSAVTHDKTHYIRANWGHTGRQERVLDPRAFANPQFGTAAEVPKTKLTIHSFFVDCGLSPDMCDKIVPELESKGLSLSLLPHLTEADLQGYGVAMFHARAVVAKAKTLRLPEADTAACLVASAMDVDGDAKEAKAASPALAVLEQKVQDRRAVKNTHQHEKDELLSRIRAVTNEQRKRQAKHLKPHVCDDAKFQSSLATMPDAALITLRKDLHQRYVAVKDTYQQAGSQLFEALCEQNAAKPKSKPKAEAAELRDGGERRGVRRGRGGGGRGGRRGRGRRR